MTSQKGIVAKHVFYGCFFIAIATAVIGKAILLYVELATPPSGVSMDWAMGIGIGTLITVACVLGGVFIIGTIAGIIAIMHKTLHWRRLVLFYLSLVALLMLQVVGSW